MRKGWIPRHYVDRRKRTVLLETPRDERQYLFGTRVSEVAFNLKKLYFEGKGYGVELTDEPISFRMLSARLVRNLPQ
jgi:hypothetical protein